MIATDRRGRPLPRRRLEPPNLSPLEVLIPVLGSKAVLVVGSAPLLPPLPVLEHYGAIVTVNGSVSSLPARVAPSVHLINARAKPHLTWNRKRCALNAAMVAQCAGRHLGTLALVTVEDEGDGPTCARLAAQGSTWSDVVSIVRSSRVALAHSVGALDRDRDRHLSVSAGMLGVVLAIWCGALAVECVGFSFDAGYAYLPPDTVPDNSRGHLRGDKTAIAALRARYPGRIGGDLFTRRTMQRPRL